MGWPIHSNPYHLHILVTNVSLQGFLAACWLILFQLKHHLDFLVREVLDEMIPAFDDVIGNKCDGKNFSYMLSQL